ncbi:unnamed protein product [Lymnaea stagnalis]|uniref:Uncharacterized protein n=1 Tax=Lymnaea stagnalis TaxID=6523 RepID=A0AAV2H2J8_LYMST
MGSRTNTGENASRSPSRTSLSISVKIPSPSEINSNNDALKTTSIIDTNRHYVDLSTPNNTSRTIGADSPPQQENNGAITRHGHEIHESISMNRPNHSNNYNIHTTENVSLGNITGSAGKFQQYRDFDSNVKSYNDHNVGLGGSEDYKKYTQMGKSELIQQKAVLSIEKAWIAYRDRQMFKLLKNSVCAAENSLSHEILRKVSPREAEFLNDRCQQVRVRFRFGGVEFPPMIFFKIYIHSGNQKVKYISGRKMIKPTTEAANDALKLMGNRNFYDQILQDTIRQQQQPISDEVDITTMKDYMQYLSNLDESPAYQGGKENYWRKLTLDVLPRHTMFFDVFDYVYNNHKSALLRDEMPLLMKAPITQEMQIRHIRAISKIRTLPLLAGQPSKGTKSSAEVSQVSSRRTRQAKLRSMKMRELYSRDLEKERTDISADDYFFKNDRLVDDEIMGDDDWDNEADQLYEWTQGLSLADDAIQTPIITI